MSRVLYYSQINSPVHENIYKLCCQCIRQGRRVIYIAPSRELIFKVRNDISCIMGGLINIDVMSFDDLEMEILKGANKSTFAADSTALSIILSGVLQRLAQENTTSFFTKVLDKSGFITGCLRIIRRLKRSMVLPEDLGRLQQELEGQEELSMKLSDLQVIYSEYCSELKRLKLKDSEDLALEAVALSRESDYFSSMGLMVVDGFIDIDGINKEVLRNITDSFTEADYICSVPFKAPAAKEFVEGQIIKDLVDMDFTLVDKGDEGVSTLEKLFSVSPTRCSDASAISINGYPCIEDEVRGAARIIKQLVMSGEKPERMAVVISSDSDYRDALPDIFDEMGLPLDMGQRIPLSSHPVARDLWALLNLKLRGMSLEGLLGVLSSRYLNLVPLEQQKASEEALKKLYDGEDTLQALEMASLEPSSFQCTTEQLMAAHGAYSRVYNAISALPDQGGIGDFVDKLTEVLDSFKIREGLMKLYKEGFISSKLFIRDVKGHFSVMETLNEIQHLYHLAGMDKRELAFREFTSILGEALRRKTITLAQSGREGVKALKPDVFRGVEYDFVFFLGLNEGVYPAIASKGGLFTLREKESLMRKGLDIGCRTLELSRSKIAFMLTCCSAKKRLFLSYRSTGEDGGYMIKSPFLEELEGLYEKEALAEVTGDKRCMRHRFEASPDEIWSIKEAMDGVIINDWQHRSPDKRLECLRRVLEAKGMHEELKDLYRLGQLEKNRLERDEFDSYDGLIKGMETVQTGKEYHFSASQINSYTSCPFKYYMERVLGISTYEDDGEFNSISEGNLYHEVLKYYYENTRDLYSLDIPLLESGLELALGKINDKKLIQVVRHMKLQEIRAALESFLLQDIDNFSAYKKSTGRELKPVYMEFKVYEDEAFKPYRFTANIDRVDLEFEDGKPTGRFIMYDYKKKNKKTTKDCLMGKDFQLAVYYHCIQRELKAKLPDAQLECIGLLYYTIENPDKDGLIRDEYKKPLGKSRKQDTLCQESFSASMEFIGERIKELSDRIATGDFRLKEECPMDAASMKCEFYQACRFDRYRIKNKRR